MFQTFDEIQKMSSANIDATMSSLEVVTKSSQAIANEVADYSKRSFENGAKTVENLLGVKSPSRAIEVQSEYAKRPTRGMSPTRGSWANSIPTWPKKRSNRTKVSSRK